MIKSFLFLMLFATSSSFAAFGQEEFFVTAPNGLICRAEPSSDSDRLGTIPYGSVVELKETTNVHFEMMDNDKLISGSWVKVRVSYTCYLFSLLDAKKFHNQGIWLECYVFDGYLEALNKATIREEKLTENQFNQLQKKAFSEKTKFAKIEDFDSIKSALGNRTTWLTAYEDDFLLLDSFTLSNGKRYQINQDSYDFSVIAYYPNEDVLLLKGGHESDVAISLKTGEMTETVGNPEYIINSPNKKIRLNGFFPGQECSSYFFQEINNGDFKYLVDFGWGALYGNQVCYFESFAWLDDTSFIYKYLDYSSNSETGEMIYCKGEIVYGAYSKGAHFEMDTQFLNREKHETPPQSDFLKIEKINENYAVAYKAYDEVFDAYSEMWILSADDTTAIDGIEANACSIESVSPNGAYAVFSTSTVRWDVYSETDSALYHKWRAILVDLSTAEVIKHCPMDCGDHWNDSNQWLDGAEVIFDGAFPPVVPPFEAYYFSTDLTQLYDYSNLWDFDGDGINDSLFFIGDGGAHLHFYPKIVLSSNAKVYEYTSFWLDMPYPDRNKEDLIKSPAIQLVVDNFDADDAYEIYLNIDGDNGVPYGNSYPKEWRKLGIATTSVLLNFENDTLILKDYGF